MKAFDVLTTPLEGTNLIEASAGTGKTTNISRIYLRLILEKLLQVDRILVVTFTEAATEELKMRIRADLRAALEFFSRGAESGGATEPEPETGRDFLQGLYDAHTDRRRAVQDLGVALQRFDESAIHTIHGFCRKVLQDNAFESASPFDTELITDQSSLVREVLDDFWRRRTRSLPRSFLTFLMRRLDPDRLYERLAPRLSRPLLELCPLPEAGDIQGMEEEIRSTMRALAHAWERGETDARAILLDGRILHRGWYRRPTLEALLLRLRDLLTGEAVPPKLPADFDKLSLSRIRRAVKKGGRLPDGSPALEVFRLCEALKEQADALEEACECAMNRFAADALVYAREELPRRKRMRNVQYFDDLIRQVYGALESPGGSRLASAVRKRYQAALIDEFQDTDPLQYAIFRRIYARGLLFLIGDPKQAIYSFRGADIFAYLEASREVSRRYTLEVNWRSTPGLVRALNALFGAHGRPFFFEGIGFHPARAGGSTAELSGESSASLQVWFVSDHEGGSGGEKAGPGGTGPPAGELNKEDAFRIVQGGVCGEIVRLLRRARDGRLALGDRPLGAEDIAVLVRTNEQARDMQSALRDHGVPSVVHSTESLFESTEAEQLLRVLEAIADPANPRAIRRGLATDLFGLSAAALDELERDERRWESWFDAFHGYHESWRRRGFMAMIRRLLRDQAARTRLLAQPRGRRRLTNYLHLFELLHQVSVSRSVGVRGLVKWLGGAISSRADPETAGAREQVADEHQLRLETDDPAVEIVTIHRSKGLDYPIVFCPFPWDARDRRRKRPDVLFHADDGRLMLDLGSASKDEHGDRAADEQLAEDLRLLYVALTRAKNRCTISWGKIRSADHSGLAYLLHPGPAGGPASAMAGLDEQAVLADLKALEAGSDGSIRIVPVPRSDSVAAADTLGPPTPEAPAGAVPAASAPAGAHISASALRFRRMTRAVRQDFSISSFSSFVAAGARGRVFDLADHDEHLLAGPAREEVEARGIFGFPRGTRAGNCFHEIFEELDFTSADAPETDALVEEKLRAFGFDRSWAFDVGAMVRRVLACPLPEGGDRSRADELRLSGIPRDATVREMEFLLPMGRVDPAGLERVFGRGSMPGDLPERLGSLGFTPVRGFLKGFIDLVFRYRDRYYIVDWKSNYLGSTREDYGAADIERTMAGELYVLQYHLYAVALHRHLGRILRNYDYGRNFGGVFYLFVRGIDPEAGGRGAGTGIFHDRPTEELIRSLDRYLGGEG